MLGTVNRDDGDGQCRFCDRKVISALDMNRRRWAATQKSSNCLWESESLIEGEVFQPGLGYIGVF